MRLSSAIIIALLAVTPAWAEQEAPPAEPPPTLTQSAPVEAAQLTPEEQEFLRQAEEFYASLHRETGVTTIANGKVSLNVPETHYFVGATDARRIIVDLWGNPPASAEGVEGIIFLANTNPAIDG